MVNIKEKISNGIPVIGTMITLFDNPEMAKLIKICGFDYFIIDCEHSYFDYSNVAHILGMAREAGIPGFVRVPEAKREVVLKYMEMGAMGLLLPNTETAEQARALVSFSKYAPLGNRGVALTRGHTGYKKPDNASEYMRKANNETVLMVQIESPKGVQNIDEILNVEGIDIAIIGPNDLSHSMGIMGQFQNPEFVSAIDRIIEAANKSKKFSGIHLNSIDMLKHWIKKGMTINLWASDTKLMCDAAIKGLERLK